MTHSTTDNSTRCGRYVGPPGDDTVYYLPRDFNAWEASWAKHVGQPAPTPVDVTRPQRSHDQGEPDPERKARQNAALRFIAAYQGRWGLILDLRADRRFGTKYMRLSDRQIEVVLNAADRDDDRAYDAWMAHQHRQFDVVGWNDDMAQDEREADARAFMSDPDVRVVVDNTVHEATAAIDDGVYLVDGVVFKVVHAVHGSGNQYAKRFDPTTKSFEYAKGAIRSIRPEHRMTLEQATEFGALYGVCMNCGRTLTDETSIAKAIGPVCSKKFAA